VTIRKFINRKIRFASASLCGGLLITGVLVQHNLNQEKEPPTLLFSAFFIGFAIMLLIKFTAKCPACKGNIGSTLMNAGTFYSLPKKIKYCPLCGIDIDRTP